MERIKIEYPSIDIAKFVMAILVVAIHVEPFDGGIAFFYNHCIARIADPLFFILTSYFVFHKALENNFSWKCLKKYMIRILKLYFSWIIIYSPIILFRTWNETQEWCSFIILLFKKIFLSGPYGAMWFLTALLLAIPLTFIVAKYTHPLFCVVVSMPFFVISTLQIEYNKWMLQYEFFQNIIKTFENIFGWLANGLNYGFFFCSLGLYIAYLKNKKKEVSLKKSLLLVFISLIALVLECYFIRIYQTGLSYGAMFFLIPTSYYLAHLLLNIKIKPRPIYMWFRKSSILIFTLHYGVMELLQFYSNKYNDFLSNKTILYIIVLIINILIATLILNISKFKVFKWMKNLY